MPTLVNVERDEENVASNYQRIAQKLVRKITLYGVTKRDMGDLHRSVVRSVQTAIDYQNCVANFLAFRAAGSVPAEGPYLRAEMDDFLFLNSMIWQQKTLDQHRQALNKVFSVELPRYRAGIATRLRGRAYTEDEVERILAELSERHARSVRLIYATGMRAFEPLRLNNLDCLPVSPERPWRSDLFVGLTDFVICSCSGKGGLIRPIAVPTALYDEIGEHRFAKPTIVWDRRKPFTPIFDLTAGQALSTAFTRASVKAIGFSLGIHGLRHSFVQRRLAQLEELGFSYRDALEICAQEVGHFRTEITLQYTTLRN
jgi:integrase